ncbi:MAG TPA: hypothetical protein VLA89_17370 [Gemmatimonadales bacterium]|nr:hypothetical protein [Gemmatimonadales bacterium]
MRKPLHVNDPVKGEVFAGYVDGKTFYREVDPAKHLVRIHQGYAISNEVVDELVDRGVETVVMIEPTRRLVSSIDDWQNYGKHFEYGHGPQTVLPVSYMGVS